MTGVVWQPRSTLSIFPAYHLEVDYLDGAPINSAATAPLTLGCETTSDHCFVWLSYLDTLITWDRRDNLLEPRNGTYLSLSLQEGGGPLGGNFDYVRVLPDARALPQLRRRRRADAGGAAAGRRAVAVVGESRRQRGRDPLLRGRRDVDARLRRPPAVAAAAGAAAARRARTCQITVPIGGNGLIDGSFEARYSLTQSLRLAAFVDFGQVTHGPARPRRRAARAVGGRASGSACSRRSVRSASTSRAGCRSATLPTLYEVDAARARSCRSPTPPNDSCFGLFGSNAATPVTDSMCVLHISIGEAF